MIPDGDPITLAWEDRSTNEAGFVVRKGRPLITEVIDDWDEEPTRLPPGTESVSLDRPDEEECYAIQPYNAVGPSGEAVTYCNFPA